MTEKRLVFFSCEAKNFPFRRTPAGKNSHLTLRMTKSWVNVPSIKIKPFPARLTLRQEEKEEDMLQESRGITTLIPTNKTGRILILWSPLLTGSKPLCSTILEDSINKSNRRLGGESSWKVEPNTKSPEVYLSSSEPSTISGDPHFHDCQPQYICFLPQDCCAACQVELRFF